VFIAVRLKYHVTNIGDNVINSLDKSLCELKYLKNLRLSNNLYDLAYNPINF
jgi:hypothetical protein